jgi:hypothetical protein
LVLSCSKANFNVCFSPYVKSGTLESCSKNWQNEIILRTSLSEVWTTFKNNSKLVYRSYIIILCFYEKCLFEEAQS